MNHTNLQTFFDDTQFKLMNQSDETHCDLETKSYFRRGRRSRFGQGEMRYNDDSILKPPKVRAPLQEVDFGFENSIDPDVIRKRRVSFAGVNKIKEFHAKSESVIICSTPAYEETFSTSSDSSALASSGGGGGDECTLLNETMDLTDIAIESNAACNLKVPLSQTEGFFKVTSLSTSATENVNSETLNMDKGGTDKCSSSQRSSQENKYTISDPTKLLVHALLEDSNILEDLSLSEKHYENKNFGQTLFTPFDAHSRLNISSKTVDNDSGMEHTNASSLNMFSPVSYPSDVSHKRSLGEMEFTEAIHNFQGNYFPQNSPQFGGIADCSLSNPGNVSNDFQKTDMEFTEAFPSGLNRKGTMFLPQSTGENILNAHSHSLTSKGVIKTLLDSSQNTDSTDVLVPLSNSSSKVSNKENIGPIKAEKESPTKFLNEYKIPFMNSNSHFDSSQMEFTSALGVPMINPKNLGNKLNLLTNENDKNCVGSEVNFTEPNFNYKGDLESSMDYTEVLPSNLNYAQVPNVGTNFGSKDISGHSNPDENYDMEFTEALPDRRSHERKKRFSIANQVTTNLTNMHSRMELTEAVPMSKNNMFQFSNRHQPSDHSLSKEGSEYSSTLMEFTKVIPPKENCHNPLEQSPNRVQRNSKYDDPDWEPMDITEVPSPRVCYPSTKTSTAPSIPLGTKGPNIDDSRVSSTLTNDLPSKSSVWSPDKNHLNNSCQKVLMHSGMELTEAVFFADNWCRPLNEQPLLCSQSKEVTECNAKSMEFSKSVYHPQHFGNDIEQSSNQIEKNSTKHHDDSEPMEFTEVLSPRVQKAMLAEPSYPDVSNQSIHDTYIPVIENSITKANSTPINVSLPKGDVDAIKPVLSRDMNVPDTAPELLRSSCEVKVVGEAEVETINRNEASAIGNISQVDFTDMLPLSAKEINPSHLQKKLFFSTFGKNDKTETTQMESTDAVLGDKDTDPIENDNNEMEMTVSEPDNLSTNITEPIQAINKELVQEPPKDVQAEPDLSSVNVRKDIEITPAINEEIDHETFKGLIQTESIESNVISSTNKKSLFSSDIKTSSTRNEPLVPESCILHQPKDAVRKRVDSTSGSMTDGRERWKIFMRNRTFMNGLSFSFVTPVKWKYSLPWPVHILLQIPFSDASLQTKDIKIMLKSKLSKTDNIGMVADFCMKKSMSLFLSEAWLNTECKTIKDLVLAIKLIEETFKSLEMLVSSLRFIHKRRYWTFKDSRIHFILINSTKEYHIEIKISLLNYDRISGKDIEVISHAGEVSQKEVQILFENTEPSEKRFSDFIEAVESLLSRGFSENRWHSLKTL